MHNGENRYKVALRLLFVLCFCASPACTPHPQTLQFEPESCSAEGYRLLLCIDLRNDRKPVGGLVIKRGDASQQGHRYVDLPFAAVAVQDNNKISSTSGKYSDRTRITYVTSSDSSLFSGVAIEPEINLLPTGSVSTEALPNAIYLTRPTAVERKFIFKAIPPLTSSNTNQGQQTIPSDVGDSLDGVAVILPSDARGIGIAGPQASIPMPRETREANGKVWYYPISDLRERKYLELGYQVTDAGYWSVAFEGAIPLVALLLVPLLALIFLKPEDRVRPRARRIGIWVGVGLESVILLALGLYLWRVSVPSESEIKLIVQSITSVLGALFGAFVLWVAIKRQPKPTSP